MRLSLVPEIMQRSGPRPTGLDEELSDEALAATFDALGF